MPDFFSVNRTSAEERLSKALTRKKLHFKQNQIIEGYEVDFWLPEYNLIIEVDGFSHLSKKQFLIDRQKDQRLIECGYIIIRIENTEIYNNITKCLYKIINLIATLKKAGQNIPLNNEWKTKLKTLKINNANFKEQNQSIEDYFLSREGKT